MKGLKIGFCVAAAAVAALIVSGPVFGAENGGGNVQSYAANQPIDFGTVVELTGENSDQVKPSTQEQMQNMFGVSVDPRQLPVRIARGEVRNETYVASSGTYTVLVSDQNGSIQSGDYLTLSSISGVAMKAGTEESTVLGRAGAAFNDSSVSLGTTTLKDVNGASSKTVKLGSVPVTINIQSNPNETSTKAKVPEVLERIGQAIAEKEVSPIRIYISLAITAVTLIATIAVLYSGVRNSIISIGRNPMSKKSIFRALLEIILTSFLILIIGLFAVYLLLRL